MRVDRRAGKLAQPSMLVNVPRLMTAMQRLIALKDRFDGAWACDTDHDRHGIVTRGAGVLNRNHYLAARS